MRVSRPSSPNRNRGMFSWAATIALLAMLIQGLASGAMAHGVTDKGAALIICSAQGVSSLTIGPDGKAHLEAVEPGKVKGQKAGLPCQDCLTALAALPAPAPAPAATPVLYPQKTVIWDAVESVIRKQARAPPRPPSRAPPIA